MNTKQHTANGQQRQAIIWGRFSSDKQSEGDSRDRQERNNRAYAKREGVKVIKEYFDEGVSVQYGPTPRFKELVASLPKDVGIIAEDLDRISRGKSWDQMKFIEELNESGHWVATSIDGTVYDSTTMAQLSTQIVGTIKTLVGNAENEKRKQRVNEEKDKSIALARKGIPAPLGAWLPAHVKYDFETGKYTIKQENKATMKRVFNEYANGKGAGMIAAGLNDDGIQSFRDKKWIRSSVAKLLHYEGVIGILNFNGERIPNAFPPAITEDLFYQVQGMLEKHTKRHGNYTAENVQNVFRGLCKCSSCGAGMYIHKAKWIGCKGYKAHTCKIKNLVPFTAMEQECISWFVPTAKEALLGKDESLPRIDALTAKKDALQGKIQQTIDLLDAGVAVNEVKARLTKLELEKRDVENKLTEAKAEQSSKAVMPDTIKELETLIDGANMGNQEIRRKIANIVPSLVSEVLIDLQYRDTPSFKVSLINGQVLEWLYNFENFVQPIIGITKDGQFALGKGKAIDGHYKQIK